MYISEQTLTEKDFRSFVKLIPKSRAVRYVLPVLGVIIIATEIFMYADRKIFHDGGNVFVLLAGVLGIAYSFFAERIASAILFAKYRKEHKNCETPDTVVFGDDCVHVSYAGHTDDYGYSLFTQLCESDGHYFLFLGPQTALIIRKDSVRDGKAEELRGFVSAKTGL